MGIYCNQNCYTCCDHCVHFYCLITNDSLGIDVDYAGVCTLHGWQVDIMDECFDFFCVAAKNAGVGFIGMARDQSQGPHALDEAFFVEQTMKGWLFKPD